MLHTWSYPAKMPGIMKSCCRGRKRPRHQLLRGLCFKREWTVPLVKEFSEHMPITANQLHSFVLLGAFLKLFKAALKAADGIFVPGGFGDRGVRPVVVSLKKACDGMLLSLEKLARLQHDHER